jgi:hypothetical protein
MTDIGEEFLDYLGNPITNEEEQKGLFKRLFATYDNAESFVLYDLPYLYAENERLFITIITVTLNLILILTLFFNTVVQYSYIIALQVILCVYSINNALSFLKGSKSYQLLNASTDNNNTTDELTSNNSAYPLRGISKKQNLRRKVIELPKAIERSEEEEQHIPFRSLTTFGKTFKIIQFIVYVLIVVLRFSIRFFTLTLFSDQTRTVRQQRRSSTIRESTSNQSGKKVVWELSQWDYSQLQKILFCFFSPLESIAISVASYIFYSMESRIFGPSYFNQMPNVIIYKTIIILLCLIQSSFVNMLVNKFEDRDDDKDLIQKELTFENMQVANRIWNAATSLLLQREHNNSIPSAPALSSVELDITDTIDVPYYGIKEQLFRKRNDLEVNQDLHRRKSALEDMQMAERLRQAQIEMDKKKQQEAQERLRQQRINEETARQNQLEAERKRREDERAALELTNRRQQEEQNRRLLDLEDHRQQAKQRQHSQRMSTHQLQEDRLRLLEQENIQQKQEEHLRQQMYERRLQEERRHQQAPIPSLLVTQAPPLIQQPSTSNTLDNNKRPRNTIETNHDNVQSFEQLEPTKKKKKTENPFQTSKKRKTTSTSQENPFQQSVRSKRPKTDSNQ